MVNSCIGLKRSKLENQLTLEYFKDINKRQEREQSLLNHSLKAADMYMGTQHLRVMEDVSFLRKSFGKEVVDLKIISAAYGLISEYQIIAPYSVTFTSMKSSEIDSWAN